MVIWASCAGHLASLISPTPSSFLVRLSKCVYSIGGPVAEAAAVATNLRLIPYIHNYNIYHLYEYGCKRVSRRWLKYKTRVYVCVCIYIYIYTYCSMYRGEKRIYPAAAGRLSFRIVLLRHMRWRMIYICMKNAVPFENENRLNNIIYFRSRVWCVRPTIRITLHNTRQIIIIYGRPRRTIIYCIRVIIHYTGDDDWHGRLDHRSRSPRYYYYV